MTIYRRRKTLREEEKSMKKPIISANVQNLLVSPKLILNFTYDRKRQKLILLYGRFHVGREMAPIELFFCFVLL